MLSTGDMLYLSSLEKMSVLSFPQIQGEEIEDADFFGIYPLIHDVESEF